MTAHYCSKCGPFLILNLRNAIEGVLPGGMAWQKGVVVDELVEHAPEMAITPNQKVVEARFGSSVMSASSCFEVR